MSKQHNYTVSLRWTGNNGNGTTDYNAYERSYSILIDGKPEILGSSDPVFRGDVKKHNPEELLVAAVSSCHMLWFLHLCAVEGIIVTDYVDTPVGKLVEEPNGSGRFKEIILHPTVTVTDNLMIEKANELHKKANAFCFIANSLNCKVSHMPTCMAK
jgi:organic hydroperoxide reductase OsmC/OhrA